MPETCEDNFSEILTISDLDEYLSRRDLRYPSVRLAKSGHILPVASYCRSIKFGDYITHDLIDNDAVHKHYSEGATIVIQLAHLGLPKIAKLASNLEMELGCGIEAHVYVTPSNASGYEAHYDTHSVMAIQIFGQKKWDLFDSPLPNPTLGQPFRKSKYTPQLPTESHLLKPGGVLYIPRGLIHAASTVSDASVHVTLGLFPPMWLDILAKHLESLTTLNEFRKSPINDYLLTNASALTSSLEALKKTFGKGIDATRAIAASIEQRRGRTRTFQSGRFRDLIYADSICLTSKLALRSRRIINIIAQPENISIELESKIISLPASVRASVDMMTSVDFFQPCNLQNELSDDAKLDLVLTLVEEGLIDIISL